MQGWQIENCVLYLATAATIIGAYYFGAGGHRLAAADAAAKAREMELLAVIEDLERLIPLINQGGTP